MIQCNMTHHVQQAAQLNVSNNERLNEMYLISGLICQFCKKKKQKKHKITKKKHIFAKKKHFLMGIFNINLPFSNDYCKVFLI